jgi:acetyltransferase-like isoleucine patch superfamily enzyme
MKAESSVLQKISPDVKFGKGVKIYDFVNLYGCEIGDNTKIGTFVEVQKGAKIGKNCKISSHTFICEGVTIEDDVFISHNVTFINDMYPRATVGGRGLQTTVGERAIIGAGSVVTKDVPPDTIVAGNPARVLRKIGEKKEG